jgi:hypothetical protein
LSIRIFVTWKYQLIFTCTAQTTYLFSMHFYFRPSIHLTVCGGWRNLNLLSKLTDISLSVDSSLHH